MTQLPSIFIFIFTQQQQRSQNSIFFIQPTPPYHTPFICSLGSLPTTSIHHDNPTSSSSSLKHHIVLFITTQFHQYPPTSCSPSTSPTSTSFFPSESPPQNATFATTITLQNSTPSTSSSSPSTPSTSSFSVSSSSCSLLNDAVPIPFPYFATAPLTHLRFFVTLFPRAFKLVLFSSDGDSDVVGSCGGGVSNWDCGSVSLCSRVTGNRVDTMEEFCRILAGKGWTFFRTKDNPSTDYHGGGGGGGVYLFRKVDVNRVRMGRVGTPDGACRMRELRLPYLDFENAPLRILQYILLMTDDIFCLA